MRSLSCRVIWEVSPVKVGREEAKEGSVDKRVNGAAGQLGLSPTGEFGEIVEHTLVTTPGLRE